MKHILAPILLLTLLFPTLAFGETMNDLVYRDGLHYKKFSDVPFTGKVTGMAQGLFKNGKKDGPWFYYTHGNGQLWMKVTYKDGKMNSPSVSYHENGQLGSTGTYKDGKMDGPWVHYWDNGQLDYKGSFKDGKEVGPWVYYYENGTVNEEYTGTYKNGVKVK